MALFVGRLHPDTETRDLEDLFYDFGRIVRCEVKRGRGFGFVEFEDSRDADDAMHELQGASLLGNRIVIEHAKGSGPRGGRDSDACFICGESGHWARDCRSKKRRSSRYSRSPSPRRRRDSRSPSPRKRRYSRSPSPRKRSPSRSPRRSRTPSPRRGRRISRSASPKHRSPSPSRSASPRAFSPKSRSPRKSSQSPSRGSQSPRKKD